MNGYPKLLILSNECLSTVSSNGRTLRNFLIGWPKEKLAQFYLRNVSPDFSVCENYYYVSDNMALRAFLTGKPQRGQATNKPEAVGSSGTSSAIKRNALTMLARDFAWNSMRWAGRDFFRWVEEFAPEMILLQAGDCGFMLRLARKLAEKYDVPLVIYNSEAYYFKNFDYFRAAGIAHWVYPVFHWSFCREFRKAVHSADRSIYLCDKLKEDYDTEFSLPSEVIYTATQMQPTEYVPSSGPLRVSYLGNMGVGRHEGLVEIANALQEISNDMKLDVYGKIPNREVQAVFDACPGIRYCGFVSYEKVQEIIRSSDLLVHTENFSDFYREDLKYAFSTKIADSLASGRCFLLYAPEDMACTDYLLRNQAAYVASSSTALYSILKQLADSSVSRMCYLEKAAALVRSNHDAGINTVRFQNILRELVKD